MDVVKPKEKIDYMAVTYLINKYQATFDETDKQLKAVYEWVPPDEKPSIEKIRSEVQTCAILYLATLEEVFDYVKKEKQDGERADRITRSSR